MTYNESDHSEWVNADELSADLINEFLWGAPLPPQPQAAYLAEDNPLALPPRKRKAPGSGDGFPGERVD